MCDLLDYFFISVAGPRQLTLPYLSKGKLLSNNRGRRRNIEHINKGK